MNKLSVIIPFLNEDKEVERTIESLLNNLPHEEDIDLIIINDASDDRYPYKKSILKYKDRCSISYYENRTRLGVARSRDLGVSYAKTPYLLFLDAHMRFYNNSWFNTLISQLEKEEKQLLCCQTSVITKVCNELVDNQVCASTYGAYIVMDPNNVNFLDVHWNTSYDISQDCVIDIPCVLGAAYACRKSYWEQLRGLSGLCDYGLDEQYISLKVWMSGGKCRLLKNIVIGHIYRTTAPYTIGSSALYYNKLLIVEVLLSTKLKYQYYKLLHKENRNEFIECIKRLRNNNVHINQLRSYYKNMIDNEFYNQFLFFNNMVEKKNRAITVDESSRLQKEIVEAITMGLEPNIHINILKHILLSTIILLWCKRTKNLFFEDFANIYLDKIISSISSDIQISFGSGLLGIGYCIEYLLQAKLVDGDANDILDELDERVKMIRWDKIKDYSLDTGLFGVIAYVFARIKGCYISNRPIPYDNEFLQMLHTAIEKCLSLNDGNNYINGDVVILLQFEEFLNNNIITDSPIDFECFKYSPTIMRESSSLINLIERLS